MVPFDLKDVLLGTGFDRELLTLCYQALLSKTPRRNLRSRQPLGQPPRCGGGKVRGGLGDLLHGSVKVGCDAVATEL